MKYRSARSLGEHPGTRKQILVAVGFQDMRNAATVFGSKPGVDITVSTRIDHRRLAFAADHPGQMSKPVTLDFFDKHRLLLSKNHTPSNFPFALSRPVEQPLRRHIATH